MITLMEEKVEKIFLRKWDKVVSPDMGINFYARE